MPKGKGYGGAPKKEGGYSSATLKKEVKDLKGPGKPETQKYPKAQPPKGNSRNDMLFRR